MKGSASSVLLSDDKDVQEWEDRRVRIKKKMREEILISLNTGYYTTPRTCKRNLSTYVNDNDPFPDDPSTLNSA